MGHYYADRTIVPEILFCPADLDRTEDRYWETDLYPVLREIVRLKQPKAILEIGTRYGYSLAVMLNAVSTIRNAYSFDMSAGVTVYGGEPNAYTDAQKNLREIGPECWPCTDLWFTDMNTQSVDSLPCASEIDIAYVDGDHSVIGCLHDIGLVYPLLSAKGWIIVDDMEHHPELRGPVENTAALLGMGTSYFPDKSHRGRMVLSK